MNSDICVSFALMPDASHTLLIIHFSSFFYPSEISDVAWVGNKYFTEGPGFFCVANTKEPMENFVKPPSSSRF